MRIGFVGLGKMGSQIVSKLMAEDHEVVVTDIDPRAVESAVSIGATGAGSGEELVSKLGDKPVIWLMIPDKLVEQEVKAYNSLLVSNSILIDGGNSFFRDTIRRSELLARNGIDYLDVGTSGGIMGLEKGFSLMVGGPSGAFDFIEPLLSALAKPHGDYKYMGPSGYGHYVKMVHNGIEYGIMQAYAEGYDLLRYGPLDNIDLATVADVWQSGSIVASTLNGLIAEIMQKNPELEGIEGYVADSGEGRWTVEIAKESNIGLPALEGALQVRLASQHGKTYFATKLLAAMRSKFGGHAVNKPDD